MRCWKCSILRMHLFSLEQDSIMSTTITYGWCVILLVPVHPAKSFTVMFGWKHTAWRHGTDVEVLWVWCHETQTEVPFDCYNDNRLLSLYRYWDTGWYLKSWRNYWGTVFPSSAIVPRNVPLVNYIASEIPPSNPNFLWIHFEVKVAHTHSRKNVNIILQRWAHAT